MPATISKPTKVIIIAGQSNATNILGPTKYTFRNTAIVKQLDTNTGAVSAASEPFLSVDSTDSTFFGEMGDLIADRGDIGTLILAPIAIAGSYSNQWTKSGIYYPRITLTISQIAALGLTSHVLAILWIQGEADADGTVGITPSQYVSNVMEAFSAFRDAGIRAPIYVPLETWALGGLRPDSDKVREAQAALVNATNRILAGPDLDTLGDLYRRPNASGAYTHFNDLGKTTLAHWFAVLIQSRAR